MKIIFLTPGSYTWASSRFRAHWVAQHLPGATVVGPGEECSLDADAFIFCKVFDVAAMRGLRERGAQVWWDVCDPMWWWTPREARAVLPYLNGVVASNPGLAADFEKWSGQRCQMIPDRLDLSRFPQKRVHEDRTPVRLIWYGAGQNRLTLFGALANLERLIANGHALTLTIYDDQPQHPWNMSDLLHIEYCRWQVEAENAVLAAHDIALLPPYPGPWGRVKSNNKILTAWACGLPVTTGEDYYDLERLIIDVNERRDDYTRLLAGQDVRESAREWEMLLCVAEQGEA